MVMWFRLSHSRNDGYTGKRCNLSIRVSFTNVIASMIYLDEQTDHTQASLAYRHIIQTSMYE
jgi:hypothetical protein